MIGKSALALVAAAAAVSLTSAAFAQSADRYGSMLPYHYDSSGVQVWGSWGPQQSQASTQSHQRQAGAQSVGRARGHNAFARAPRRSSSPTKPGN